MMMMMKKKEGSLLRIIIAVALTLLLCFLTADSEVRCIESERHALLNFKQHLTDPSNRLASWAASSDVDCCHWVGVLCHNVTGHVVQLRLRSHYPVYDEFTTYDEDQREAQYEAYERSVFGASHSCTCWLDSGATYGLKLSAFRDSNAFYDCISSSLHAAGMYFSDKELKISIVWPDVYKRRKHFK